MLLGLGVGFGVTFCIGLLIILPLWWRNRKIICLVSRESRISKALQEYYRPSVLSYQQYARRP